MNDEIANRQRETSVNHMKAALKELVGHRSQIQPGKELLIARFWPVVGGAFSLLEQSLKLLVSVHKQGYLDGTGENKGETARDDSHKLSEVFGKLKDEDKNLLEEHYGEYASFVQFDSEFSTLGQYLNALDKHGGQVAWRYSLLESTRELPGPLKPDILLELIAGTIDILSREVSQQWHGMHGIHLRLERALKDALGKAAENKVVSPDSMSAEDMTAWVRERHGPRLLNTFSRHIRAGSLDGEHGKGVSAWLDNAMGRLRKSAKESGDVNLLRFLQMAASCCATTDGKRFTFRNHLPQNIWESPRPWREDWAVSWREADAPWRTVAIDYPPNHHYEDWGLPLRAGQRFAIVLSEMEDAPTVGEIDPTKAMDLRILRNEKVLAQMRAKLSSYPPPAHIVDEDELPESMGQKVTDMEFIRVGDCLPEGESGDADAPGFPQLGNSYACLECAGTGFCPDCLGSAETADDCQTCPDATGLCLACKGYRMDGHHEIMASTEAS